MKNLILFVLLLVLSACSGSVSEGPGPDAPLSCDLLDETPTLRVFAFSYPDARAPGCKALGGAVFECPADYCLASTELGTCPHCFGGGE